MTLEELKAQIPSEFVPWAETYGPAFLAMTAEEVKAWIELLAMGDVMKAYKEVLEKLPNAELLSAWTTINAEWQSANEKNAARIELQKEAAIKILGILLTIAAAAVGL